MLHAQQVMYSCLECLPEGSSRGSAYLRGGWMKDRLSSLPHRCPAVSGTSCLPSGMFVRGMPVKYLIGCERRHLNKTQQRSVNIYVIFFFFLLSSYRASVLKTVIKSKNQFLRLLNHAVSVSFLLMADTTTDLPIKEKPIRCHFETSWSRLLQKDSLSLVCFLHNSSPFVLERGWTLSITVSPLSYSSSPAGESSSTNFSFPFHDLRPGQTFEASLPIAAAGDASFPMTVSCSLIFSLSSLLGEEEVAASFAGLQSSCISLPLSTLTVDWLHALQLNSPTATHKMATVQPSSAAADSIQTFLSSRQLRCSGRTNRGGESAAKPEPEKYSASVWVSSEIVRDTLKPKKSSNLDAKESIRDPEDLCLSLLERLLSEDTEGVKMGCQGDKIALSTSVAHARGPNGAAMKLTVKEVNRYLI